MAFPLNTDEDGEISATPLKYVPLCEVYSATAPCVSAGGGSSMSKKVKARKLSSFDHPDDRKPSSDVMNKPAVTQIYARRGNRPSPKKPSIFDRLLKQSKVVKSEVEEGVGDEDRIKKKRRKIGGGELSSLGVDSGVLLSPCTFREERSKRRKSNVYSFGNGIKRRLKSNGNEADNASQEVATSGSIHRKKWARMSFNGDPKRFVGLQCKVFWPLDDDWYYGSVVGYNSETDRHHVLIVLSI